MAAGMLNLSSMQMMLTITQMTAPCPQMTAPCPQIPAQQGFMRLSVSQRSPSPKLHSEGSGGGLPQPRPWTPATPATLATDPSSTTYSLSIHISWHGGSSSSSSGGSNYCQLHSPPPTALIGCAYRSGRLGLLDLIVMGT